jgi:hypothetical protein
VNNRTNVLVSRRFIFINCGLLYVVIIKEKMCRFVIVQ